MKNKTRSYFARIIFLLLLVSTGYHLNAQVKVVGYVPNWIDLNVFSNSIDYSKVTHLNIAFENPDASGNLSYNSGNSALITKAHSNGVKVLVSIGGGSASEDATTRARYFDLISDSKRASFVQKIVSYINTHSFDGIDVDLEGPAINGDYGKFIADLNNALPTGKLLSAALSQGYGGPNVPSSTFAHFDWINIMAYDATGPWDPSNPGQHSSYDFAVNNVTYWTGRGLAKAKCVLGLPFYGYGFGSAYRSDEYSYAEIVNTYAGAENKDQVGSTIWYNGIPTIKQKTTYAVQQQLGGVMIWQLASDATGTKSLLLAISQVVNANPAPTVSITSPANGATFTAPANITINVTASDANGTVSKVEFFQGATKLGEDLTSPYSFTWSNVAASSYSLTAKATDNLGAATTSSAVNITVSGPPSCVPVVASADDGNVAANVLDNNLATRWSASGDPQWIQFCLTDPKTVNGVKIAFFKGNERASRFDILVSQDGVGFTTAATGLVSSGTSLDLETFTLAPQTAKYVRILGHGNTLNLWNSYTEVQIMIVTNVSPTVSITSPANNSTFTTPATVTIDANAADSDGTVSKVEFFNGATKLGEDLTSPYSFIWNNVAIGTYSLTAKATDNGGAATTSSPVTITVQNTPPSVSLTSPASGASYTAPASVDIAANASDANGAVAKVEFFQGSTKLGEDLTSPYTFTWSNVAAGSYSLTAKATDDLGTVTTSSAIAITVNNPAGLPAPWVNADVGAVGAAGSASHSSGTFTVNGSGADIWGAADEFHYVYQPVSGDVEITARVNSVTNTNAWTKAGLMIRESLAAGSTHAMVVVTPGNGVSFQRRLTTGATSASTASTGVAPLWLKMKRAASTFIASSSVDGVTWTTIGTVTITMAANVQVGLALTSHADGTLATAAFSNVSVTGPTPPCDPAIASADDGNVAGNVLDNNLATRWSASGDPQWIQFCLGTSGSVSGVQIAFYKGNERQSIFDVLVSSDATTWTTAATGLRSSGTSLNLETFSFTPITGKYVRIVGHGNSLNLWNSYTEVKITSSSSSSSARARSTSAETISYEKTTTEELSCYPNPARDHVTITYPVQKAGKVRLAIYNGVNNQTTLLLDEDLPAGTHQNTFDINHLPTGLHIIKLMSDGKLTVQKMIKQ